LRAARTAHVRRIQQGRCCYACQLKKDHHADAAWYATHANAIRISERVLMEAVHSFFEGRIFGPHRVDLCHVRDRPGSAAVD